MTVTETQLPVMGWSGVIMRLNVWAGNLDRRLYESVDWPDLPLTLGENHNSDDAVGSVDFIEVRGDDVWAHGRFSATNGGIEAASQLQELVLRHVSVEIRDGEFTERYIEDEDGERWEMVWHRATIGALSLERRAAFAEAVIMSDEEAAAWTPATTPGTAAPDGGPDEGVGTIVQGDNSAELRKSVSRMRTVGSQALVRAAGAGPHTYPARMFSKVPYTSPTRLTISSEGEVTGHVCVWGKTHRADGSWLATRSPQDDLSEWLVGATALDNGDVIRTGVLVADGLHAPVHEKGTRADKVRRLIESTACQVATLNAWPDEHGIAVHGSTLPGVTVEQATRAMAGCPSIDQRNLGDGRGFVTMGVLMVNTCGFTPGDAVVSMEDGEPVRRLVASAAVPEHDCGCGGTCGTCSHEEPIPLVQASDNVAWYPASASTSSILSPSVWGVSTRAASAEPEPQAPKVVDLKALSEQDAAWERQRLAAAVARKPKP